MTATLHTVGFDVSLRRTGWAALTYDAGDLAARGVIISDPGSPLPARLAQIRSQTIDVLTRFDGSADVAIEGGFQAPNGDVTRKLAMAWGVVLLAVWCHENIEAHVVAPTEVKRLATGKGNANKDEVTAAAVERWGPTVDDSDIADACWPAPCA
jgi:Holliday junction resolvasome RuvABC endonuclease subunit